MTRTKIERVGGHLLIEGGSYTGVDNCQDVATPIATLRVENRNAREVFIWAEGDPLHLSNVIAHGWTAREILEVAYGPQTDAEKDEEIAVLREALENAEGVIQHCLECFEFGAEHEVREELEDYERPPIREAAKVGR